MCTKFRISSLKVCNYFGHLDISSSVQGLHLGPDPFLSGMSFNCQIQGVLKKKIFLKTGK